VRPVVQSEPEPEPVLIEAEPREVASPPLNGSADNGSPAEPVRAEPVAPPAARRTVPPVVPLAHVPDDPGPEPEAAEDAELESTSRPVAWQRIRQLFR